MFLSNSFLSSRFSRNPILYLSSSSVLSKTFVNLLRTFSVASVRCSENSNVRIENQINESVEKNNSSLHDLEVEDHFVDEESENIVESPRNSKILKATIIGNPNVGKSTLINQIVGRQIFAISSKVHTTRCRARAVYIQGSTQLVFLDTPGLVTGHESSKYNLEKSFLSDSESSIQEADIVGVVHDVSSDRHHDRLDPKVLRLLHFYPSKHTILIINKIDCLRSKRVLLDIANDLTCFKLQNTKQTISIREELKDEWSPKTEFSIDKAMKKQKGWPFFKEIFMVSALDGSGVGDIKEYLVQNAKPGDWLFPRNAFTDQTYIKMIEESVQARLLDNLPNEIPYNLTTQLEYYDRGRAGNVIAVVLIGCKTPRIEKLVMGPGGKRIRIIAKSAEQDLENTFRVPVKLRVVVTKKKEKTVSIDELIKSGSLDVLENN